MKLNLIKGDSKMKECICKKWQEDSQLDHHNEYGRIAYKNTFKYCPWCKKKLKWTEI
jgi:hypothetical protein